MLISAKPGTKSCTRSVALHQISSITRRGRPDTSAMPGERGWRYNDASNTISETSRKSKGAKVSL